MSGYGDFTVKVFRNGEEVQEAEVAWDWDDDDEDRLRISGYIRRPPDF